MEKEYYSEIFIPIITSETTNEIMNTANTLTHQYIIDNTTPFMFFHLSTKDMVLYDIISNLSSMTNLCESKQQRDVTAAKIVTLAKAASGINEVAGKEFIQLKNFNYLDILNIGYCLTVISELTTISKNKLLSLFGNENDKLLMTGFIKDKFPLLGNYDFNKNYF